MPLTPGSITFDAHDVVALAQWWAERLDGSVVYTQGDTFAVLSSPHSPVSFCFQKARADRVESNRVHVDLVARDDLTADVARLVEAGATEIGSHEMEGGITWVVLTDPEQNHFCVSSQPAGTWFFTTGQKRVDDIERREADFAKSAKRS